MTEEATIAKAVAMSILFLCSTTLGLIPIKLSQWFKWNSNSKNNTYVQVLLCLGGGVLLCTTFLHLLPEVAESVEELDELSNAPLPLAELLMCLGFFTMYLVEELVHYYLHHKENAFKTTRSSISISRGDLNIESHRHSHVGHSHIMMENSAIATIRGLLIVLALSIHELFEGLAVGLEKNASHVWYMFGAVSAHKLVIAFCIGVELVTSNMKTMLVVVYVFVFAVVSPLGIGIGIVISEEEEQSTKVVSVILQGLATGTLLYVVFFEILRDERKRGIVQYCAVLLGFCLMLGMTFMESE